MNQDLLPKIGNYEQDSGPNKIRLEITIIESQQQKLIQIHFPLTGRSNFAPYRIVVVVPFCR